MSPKEEIQTLMEKFSSAWNGGDAKGAGGKYAEDGCLISPFGDEARGRAAIDKMFAELFSTVMKGSKTSLIIENVRQVGDVALVDATQTVKLPPGAPMPEVKFHLYCTMQKQGGDWKIIDGRPYAFAPRPPPPR